MRNDTYVLVGIADLQYWVVGKIVRRRKVRSDLSVLKREKRSIESRGRRGRGGGKGGREKNTNGVHLIEEAKVRWHCRLKRLRREKF